MQPQEGISIFSLHYPPDPTGIAPYAGALAVGISRTGQNVTAHVAHPHYPEWRIRDGYGQWILVEKTEGVDVRRRLHYVPRHPRGMRRLLSELSFGARVVLASWGRPRLVIAVSPALFATALVALRLRLAPRRIPLIVWVQDIYTLGLAEIGEGGNFAAKITRWVESHTLRAADRVVVIHQGFADYLEKALGVDAAQVVVVRNWTHLPATPPIDVETAKAAIGWPHDVTLAVHTGNMGAKQGLENVVEAARLADEKDAPVQFVLVGDGGERHGLEEQARGIARISFVDPLDDAEYRLALAAADVLLVNEKPGVAAMAVPSKLTSYFGAGRPVVAATDPGGFTASEIAASEAGIVVPAGAPDALLDAVLGVSMDKLAAAQLGVNGRRYRESVLDAEVAIEHWVRLINEVGAPIRCNVNDN